MAQPPKYERKKDFTENEGDRTDHAAINMELDSAGTSINSIRTNLAILQADDGKLRPGVVTFDSINQDVYENIANQVHAQVQDDLARAEAAADRAEAAIKEVDDLTKTGLQQIGAARDEAVTTINGLVSGAEDAAAAAAASATAAANSATAAKTSETNAAASEAAAAASATAAENSASEAAASASDSADSAAEAEEWASVASAGALRAIATGTPDKMAVTFPTPITAIADQAVFWIRVPGPNETPSPTLKVDELDKKPIQKLNGMPLLARDLVRNVLLQYDKILDAFIVLNPNPYSGDKTPLFNNLTIWVQPGGSDTTGDGSESNPFNSVQRAIEETYRYRIDVSRESPAVISIAGTGSTTSSDVANQIPLTTGNVAGDFDFSDMYKHTEIVIDGGIAIPNVTTTTTIRNATFKFTSAVNPTYLFSQQESSTAYLNFADCYFLIAGAAKYFNVVFSMEDCDLNIVGAIFDITAYYLQQFNSTNIWLENNGTTPRLLQSTHGMSISGSTGKRGKASLKNGGGACVITLNNEFSIGKAEVRLESVSLTCGLISATNANCEIFCTNFTRRVSPSYDPGGLVMVTGGYLMWRVQSGTWASAPIITPTPNGAITATTGSTVKVRLSSFASWPTGSTGRRYFADQNSTIVLEYTAQTLLPGNAVGAVANSGVAVIVT